MEAKNNEDEVDIITAATLMRKHIEMNITYETEDPQK